jgi:hypothetical protein
MAEVLGELDMFEIFKPLTEPQVYRAAAQTVKHAACPVPSAILKAVEVAAELALPKDVIIKIER